MIWVIPSGGRSTSRDADQRPVGRVEDDVGRDGVSVAFARTRFVRKEAFSRIGARVLGVALAKSAGPSAGRAWPTLPPETNVDVSLWRKTDGEEDITRIAP